MKRPAIALAGLAAAVITSTATFGAQAASSSTQTLVLTSRSTTSTLFIPCHSCVLRSTPSGAHIGGIEVDAGALTDQHGHRVGHFAIESTGMTPFTSSHPGELMLIATLVINGSQITVQGLEEPPDSRGTAAITGGTGAYANARGTVRYTDNRNGSTTLRIRLTA